LNTKSDDAQKAQASLYCISVSAPAGEPHVAIFVTIGLAGSVLSTLIPAQATTESTVHHQPHPQVHSSNPVAPISCIFILIDKLSYI